MSESPICKWCGKKHDLSSFDARNYEHVCPAVMAIEYHSDGSVRRVEFYKIDRTVHHHHSALRLGKPDERHNEIRG